MKREKLTLSDTYNNDIYDIYDQDGEKRIQILVQLLLPQECL